MTGFNSKRDAAADRDALFEKLEVEQPAQELWLGLTDEEIHGTAGYNETREMYQFAIALMAKLKEKNT